MAKDEQPNQLNLTVVALVALVAIVGLVALVMNAASIRTIPSFATGSEIVSAADEEQNLVGDARRKARVSTSTSAEWDFNNDRVVNNDDVNALATGVMTLCPTDKICDVGRDGKVGPDDVFALSYYLRQQYGNTYIYGYDYNNDGVWNTADSEALSQIVMGNICYAGKNCDVNRDGAITPADVFVFTNIVNNQTNNQTR